MTRSNKPSLDAVSPAAPADERVRTVMLLIETSGYSRAALQETAGSVYLSVSRLSHLFKEEVGLSPLEYAKALKLERARELIEKSQAQIKEIAGIIGYRDAKCLARDFKRAYGLTPKNYRKRLRAETAARSAAG